MSNRLFRWSVRVYYEDTDAGGVVYHARYVAFYERARTEMLRQRDFYQRQSLENDHIAFAVRRMTVDYLAPAHLDDMLEVQSEVTEMRRTSLTFAQRILDSHGNLLNNAEVLIVCVDPHKMKPVVLPESIVAEFKQ